MPIKKWVIQGSIAFPLLFGLLAGVQYVKGRGIEYSIEFGVIWSLISIALFFGSRVYYFKKGLYCKVCNDFPEQVKNEDKN